MKNLFIVLLAVIFIGCGNVKEARTKRLIKSEQLKKSLDSLEFETRIKVLSR